MGEAALSSVFLGRPILGDLEVQTTTEQLGMEVWECCGWSPGSPGSCEVGKPHLATRGVSGCEIGYRRPPRAGYGVFGCFSGAGEQKRDRRCGGVAQYARKREVGAKVALEGEISVTVEEETCHCGRAGGGSGV